MLKGSEGVFGVLVELTIKIFRYMPENRKYFGYIFHDWESAVSAAREICQGQFGLPAVFRISTRTKPITASRCIPSLRSWKSCSTARL